MQSTRSGSAPQWWKVALYFSAVTLCVPAMSAEPVPYGHEYFTLRNGLSNARIQFERFQKGRVAFLGGSITHNPGWRDKVCEDLRRRFPETEFDFINAGIPSMGSTPGAFRLVRDVFQRGPVDLLFVEAAVNDSTNGRSGREQIRGMEGIVRHAREIHPAIDIVMMHFVDPQKMQTIEDGGTPSVIDNHEKVAEHYQTASLDLALEVTERIRAGEFTWDGDFKNLHPSPFGQEVYFRSIKRMIERAWNVPLDKADAVTPHDMPEEPLDIHSYIHGRLVDIDNAEASNGWTSVESWEPTDGAGTRKRFVRVPMLTAENPGAELHFDFEGSAVGIFVAAGPDAGIVEYSIDGGPSRKQDLFTKWSQGLHLPWAYVLEAELERGPHRLTVRVSKDRNENSKGHAVRVAHFIVN